MEFAVRFENVTKRYPRGGSSGDVHLRHELIGALSRAGNLVTRRQQQAKGTLALDGVSFEVERGQSFAVVGPNGAGKSTALKLMTRISYPTHGRIRVRGRVAALIEVTGGIHPELSGRENIWLFGRILGMDKNAVRRRFDQIVEFSEIGHALDRQVKMYSSGMQLRLAFSIAAHLEPDIFVVDEALAVGDAGFQAKCVERMTQLVREGRSLVLVSHDLAAVEAVCESGIFLLGGQVHAAGTAREVVRTYLDWIDSGHQGRLSETTQTAASQFIALDGVTFHDREGRQQAAFATGDDVEVRMRFRSLSPLRRPHVSIGITDGRPGNLVLCSMLVDGGAPEVLDGEATVSCHLRNLPLLPRVYQVYCSVWSEHGFGDLLEYQPIGAFRVASDGQFQGPAPDTHMRLDGPVFIPHEWEVVTDRRSAKSPV
jgi:ABC-type polysaccharide/polyol phosphate transport system ATPase subunit